MRAAAAPCLKVLARLPFAAGGSVAIMPNTHNPEAVKLLQAVAAEKEAMASSLVRYQALTAKIAAYQSGEGPEPTEVEFLQWRDDVKLAVRLKQLQSGLSES
jgi:hypothetical protein